MNSNRIQAENAIVDKSLDAIVNRFDAKTTPRRRQHKRARGGVHATRWRTHVN